MAKLRHIAMGVSDVPKTVKFYEEVFGMKRVNETPLNGAIFLTDGVVSLAIIDNVAVNYPPLKGHHGLHHIGFICDDVPKTREDVTLKGGGTVYQADDPIMIREMSEVKKRTGGPAVFTKFCDPNGVEVDVLDAEYARRTYHIEG